MGASYRDYIKSRKRAARRAGQAGDLQDAINARAKAIREKNRKKTAHEAQGQARLDAF